MIDDISKPLVRKRLPLSELLRFANSDELAAIVDIILSHEGERLFHDNDVRRNLLNCRAKGELNWVTDIIANEICQFGSNSIVSFLRKGEPVSYDEVVRDVAKECKIKFSDKAELADIEKEILFVQMANIFTKKNREEIENLLISAGFNLNSDDFNPIKNKKYSSMLAAQMLGGANISFSGWALVSLISARTIPVVGALTMVKATHKKSSPSLMVILPAVVRIAAIRQRLIKEDFDNFFTELRACL